MVTGSAVMTDDHVGVSALALADAAHGDVAVGHDPDQPAAVHDEQRARPRGCRAAARPPPRSTRRHGHRRRPQALPHQHGCSPRSHAARPGQSSSAHVGETALGIRAPGWRDRRTGHSGCVEQAPLPRHRDELELVVHAELAVEVLHIAACRVDGDARGEPRRAADRHRWPASRGCRSSRRGQWGRPDRRSPHADTPGAAAHSETRLGPVDGEGVRPQTRDRLDDDAEADGLGEEPAGARTRRRRGPARDSTGRPVRTSTLRLGVTLEELARRLDRVTRIGLRRP